MVWCSRGGLHCTWTKFQCSAELAAHPIALSTGAAVLVNGSVSVVSHAEVADAIQRESLTLVYNTEHAVREVEQALPHI
jgi:hypothetical protein